MTGNDVVHHWQFSCILWSLFISILLFLHQTQNLKPIIISLETP